MLGSTIFVGLLSTAAAVAVPRAHHNETLNVTYYQGQPSISGAQSTCGYIPVASGNITTGVCHQEYTYSLSITALPKGSPHCRFTLWQGTTTCDDSEATSKNVTKLPADGESYCVTTNVLDGGAHTYASGLLTCA